MIKRTTIGLFLSLIVLGCSTERDVEPGIESTFAKFYGSINQDEAFKMITTSDGGYLLVGSNETELVEESIYKIHAIKIDRNGNVEFDFLYPQFEEDINAEDERINLTARSVVEVTDGYILVGDSIYDEDFSNMLALKIDFSGNYVTHQTYSYSDGNLLGTAISQHPNGNLVLLAQITDNSSNGNMYMSGIDVNLNELWFHDYGIDGDDNETVSKSLVTLNGDITWSGTVKRNPDENDIRIISTAFDSKNVYYDESIGINNTRNEESVDIKPSSSGFVVVGTTDNTDNGDNDMFVISTNFSGQVIWSKTFGGLQDEKGAALMVTRDNYIVALGSTMSFGNGENDLYVVKLDMAGNPVWTESPTLGRTFGGLNDELGADIIQAIDGGYLILGTEDFGDVGTMILMKTDQNGKL